MFDRGLCPADRRAETENERIEAENGEKQGTDRNGELRIETEFGGKRGNKERSRDAGNGSEGREC